MNILFVCTGNINRSAAAHLIARRQHGSNSRFAFSSAGTGRGAGKHKTSAKTRRALKRVLGMDVSPQPSQPVTRDLLGWADKVVCMAPVHETAVLSIQAPISIIRLWEYQEDSRKRGRIEDPAFDSDPNTADRMVREIHQALDNLLRELT